MCVSEMLRISLRMLLSVLAMNPENNTNIRLASTLSAVWYHPGLVRITLLDASVLVLLSP